MKQVVDNKNVIQYAGAFIAFLIGSGFATGQEVLQYFCSYGYLGILGIVVIFGLFLYVGVNFITVGFSQKFEKSSDIFKYYCGNLLGTFFDYFSIVFIYMSFVVMIAGAGATVSEQYHLPVQVGGILMGILAMTTVIFGLGKIVDVIGKIGPVIVVLSIGLGLSALIMNPTGLKEAGSLIPELDIMKASSNWLFAAGSYVGFCMLWLASFMAALGKRANSKKEASRGAILGATGFSLAVLIVALGMLANIEQVSKAMVPTLLLAGNIHPIVATVFSVIVVLGIYTTSVPLLWSVSARFTEEKTTKFRILTVVLALIGIYVGLEIPFNKLVNVVYVINGYVGILLLAAMVLKSVRNKMTSDQPLEKVS
ncbi:hypothetical protein EZV73_13140 [Acidaminobacter sp. JC074]|uniref:YkvI family membrane protein n=1 Tax=Acidaminobacter sp. JC074 TaxID=2530199 RepID=UPI001F0E6A23|nr:hypothetical protein [Acidaminobacter sp. JC074]MCH4888531.1 hypothetical protein [Acidaminobacter sp. JC074]